MERAVAGSTLVVVEVEINTPESHTGFVFWLCIYQYLYRTHKKKIQFSLKQTVTSSQPKTHKMTKDSQVGSASIYEAGDQRNYSRDEQQKAKADARFDEGKKGAHSNLDSSMFLSLPLPLPPIISYRPLLTLQTTRGWTLHQEPPSRCKRRSILDARRPRQVKGPAAGGHLTWKRALEGGKDWCRVAGGGRGDVSEEGCAGEGACGTEALMLVLVGRGL